MLSIDEAISHAREVAEKQRKDNDNCEYKAEYGCKGCADYYSKPCIECAEEHEQLAEWLEELKAYREIGTVEECRNSVLDIQKAYNKAIDDFAEKLKEMANNSSTKYIRLSEKETIVTYGVEQIVKQLKEDGENNA